MRRHFWRENGNKILTGLLIAAGAILMFFFFTKAGTWVSGVRKILHIIAPVISGGIIAYLVSPICNAYEEGMLHLLERTRFMKKETTRKKVSELIGVSGSMLTLIALIVLFLVMILPQLWSSIVSMVNSISTYTDNVITLTKNLFAQYPELEKTIIDFWQDAESHITNIFQTQVLPNVDTWLSSVTNGVSQTFKFFYNFIIGMIVAVYMLASRKTFAAQSIKMLYAALPSRQAGSVLRRVRFADRIFGKFISGKIVDSLIIGAIAMVGTNLLKMPYATLISVIICMTNVIPFFGPIIGAVPCVFITLIVDPLKALYLLLFIIVLQQVDGNIIGPKILGESTGLSGFWVLFSILLFGGLFGVVGMVIGVPLFAVIYSIISDWIRSRLEQKHLATDTVSYMDFADSGAEEDTAYLE